ATFLREMGRSTLAYLVAFNLGSIVGKAVWGRVSEGRPGRRGAATIAALAGGGGAPLYVFMEHTRLRFFGALVMGSFRKGGVGVVVPTYVPERCQTAVRGVGAGFVYHAGAALGALTPFVVGALQVDGWKLPHAMAVCIVSSLVIVIAMLWIGPETRGRKFLGVDGS